jgi:hypothetical protein
MASFMIPDVNRSKNAGRLTIKPHVNRVNSSTSNSGGWPMSGNNSPFHRGERAIQSRLGIRDKMEQLGHRMIRDHMPEQHRAFFSPLATLMVGSVDAEGWPWASVLAGQPGFLQAVDPRISRVRARPSCGDPLNKALVEGEVEYLEEPLDPPDPDHVSICCSIRKSRLVIEV